MLRCWKKKEVRFVIVGEHSNHAAFVLSANRYREWRSERYAALHPAYDAIRWDCTQGRRRFFLLKNGKREKREIEKNGKAGKTGKKSGKTENGKFFKLV
jgi:hypothetical protein